MSKVYGMHMIALLPGVKAEDFEKFFIEEVNRLPLYEGWKLYLLKGERGDREGKYLVMFEIESLEARERYAPLSGPTAEAKKVMDAVIALGEKWATFASPMGPNGIYTDYVVVGK